MAFSKREATANQAMAARKAAEIGLDNASESRQNLLTALVSAGQESGFFTWRGCCDTFRMTGSSRASPGSLHAYFRMRPWCIALNDAGGGGKKRRVAAKDSAWAGEATCR